MQVESYEQITLDEQNGEVINELVSEEALALIESLDLSGQRDLVEIHKTESDEQTETRNPYRKMTVEEQRVFLAVMPRRTDIHKYSSDPIPLRVLQIAAHAQTLFDELEVWHPEDARDDPLLVGLRKIPGQTWGKEMFVLARWGEHLVSFEDLKLKAAGIIKAKLEASLIDAKENIATFERTLEQNLAVYLNGGREKTCYANISF